MILADYLIFEDTVTALFFAVCSQLKEILCREKTSYLVEDNSNQNLKCLAYENITGMMFYGNSNTYQPELWIATIKVKNTMLSILLRRSMEGSYSI
jgi:hypothetical protein